MKIQFRVFVIGIMAFMILIFFMEPAIAGPGGKIASAVYRTFWGKVAVGLLVILFLPLIIYTWIKEYFAERRTLKDLRTLAMVSKDFEWLSLRDRVIDCFHRVHAAWRTEDLAEASEWMTDWYWRNQQTVFLNRWADEGLVNRCRVKRITSIRPLFLAYRKRDASHDGSRIAVSIAAHMEDYLARRDTGDVVEGKKGFRDVETVWTFTFENGKWRVANIEEDSMLLTYAELPNQVPAHAARYEMS